MDLATFTFNSGIEINFFLDFSSPRGPAASKQRMEKPNRRLEGGLQVSFLAVHRYPHQSSQGIYFSC